MFQDFNADDLFTFGSLLKPMFDVYYSECVGIYKNFYKIFCFSVLSENLYFEIKYRNVG